MGKKAVLFIHGFSANFAENEYCINKLQQFQKYDVYIFTLPGHENFIMDSKVTYDEWIKASEEMLKKLLKIYHEVYLIGHSMGGVIASYLATIYPVRKLVLIAPAFEYLNLEQNKKDLLENFHNHSKKDSGFEGLLEKIITVRVSNIKEFRKLVDKYHDEVIKVNIPTLLLHGDIDNVVPIESSVYAYKSIKTDKKFFTILSDVRHQVFISEKKDKIVNYIYEFLRRDYTFKKVYKDKL